MNRNQLNLKSRCIEMIIIVRSLCVCEFIRLMSISAYRKLLKRKLLVKKQQKSEPKRNQV